MKLVIVNLLVLFLIIKPEEGWIHQILQCLNALQIGETIKSASSAVMIIIKTVRILCDRTLTFVQI